jgi:hypothetical protein
MGMHEYGGDDSAENPANKVFKEFDCPACYANNPYDEGFRSGDEVRCFYCGQEYKVRVDDSGRLKLREI